MYRVFCPFGHAPHVMRRIAVQEKRVEEHHQIPVKNENDDEYHRADLNQTRPVPQHTGYPFLGHTRGRWLTKVTSYPLKTLKLQLVFPLSKQNTFRRVAGPEELLIVVFLVRELL